MKLIASLLIAAVSLTSFTPRASALPAQQERSLDQRLSRVLDLQYEVSNLQQQIALTKSARSAAATATGTTLLMTAGLAALTGGLARAANGSVTGLIFVIPTMVSGGATIAVGATAVGSGFAIYVTHKQLRELEARLVRIQALLDLKEEQLRAQMR